MNNLTPDRLRRILVWHVAPKVSFADKVTIRRLVSNRDALQDACEAMNIYAQDSNVMAMSMPVGGDGRWVRFWQAWNDMTIAWVDYVIENWDDIIKMITSIVGLFS